MKKQIEKVSSIIKAVASVETDPNSPKDMFKMNVCVLLNCVRDYLAAMVSIDAKPVDVTKS